MAATRNISGSDKPRRPPATTPQARENQLISRAVDLAEQQILDKTASSQVITHFLKLGSSRERLEQEKLVAENNLLRAKIEYLSSAEDIKLLYGEALKAMRAYSGQEIPEDYDD